MVERTMTNDDDEITSALLSELTIWAATRNVIVFLELDHSNQVQHQHGDQTQPGHEKTERHHEKPSR
jgi:hypothetical protein